MKERLRAAVLNALRACGVEATGVTIEHAELSHGDYATGAALQYAKAAGLPPRALAEKIVAALGSIDGVEMIDIAGPGFINFHLTAHEVTSSLAQASDASWGTNDSRTGKRVMVEYTDPNPFKEFHIGHLMSNAIGESISRLIEISGAEVFRANYQGDVGPHVAKAIWGLQKLGLDASDASALGRAYAEGARAYESDANVKNEIDEINAKVYDRSDATVNELYDAGRKASLEHFEELYATLGTTFDHYFFESETAPRGLAIVRANPGVFEESDGAVVYKGEKLGLHTRVFITSKGLPTYETKDLGLAQLKNEIWQFDESITVTANEQKEYFAVVLAAMKDVMPDIAEKIRHVTHGMMRLPTGKMSSRTGDVITGESLLNELEKAARERAKESRAGDHEKLGSDVAVAAIKYQILKQGIGKDIIFDRERALSLEGDSGPYLQYTHARTAAVVSRATSEGVAPSFDLNAPRSDVARLTYRFADAVSYAAQKGEPHLLVTYLIDLASAFNSWYGNEQILDGTPAAAHKVALTGAVHATLAKGLWILGIPAPDKM